jgi:hypothetical protein
MGGAARAVAGFGSSDIRTSNTGARNYMQLIVAQNGAAVSFSDARQQDVGDPGAAFQVDVTSGKTYDFLLLMGHWEKADGNYKDGVPPTLLAAGLNSKEIQAGINTVTISMYPIVVETEFTAGDVKVESPENGRVFPLIPGNWNAVWTVTRGVTGTNPFDILVDAQKKISGQTALNTLKLKAKSAVVGGASQPADANLSGNVFTLGIGNYTLPQTGTTGYANFKLEYVPFGILDPAKWENFDGLGKDAEGLPVWIIRNGINDLAQTAQTSFAAPSAWDGTANGNGAVPWVITVKTPGGSGSSLTVTGGSYTWPAHSTTGTVGFTTGGYSSGTADAYYAVAAQGEGPSEYSDYKPLAAELSVGAHTGKPITLPAASGNYDVYVVIYKDGEVSAPLIINVQKDDAGVDIGWAWG